MKVEEFENVVRELRFVGGRHSSQHYQQRAHRRVGGIKQSYHLRTQLKQHPRPSSTCTGGLAPALRTEPKNSEVVAYAKEQRPQLVLIWTLRRRRSTSMAAQHPAVVGYDQPPQQKNTSSNCPERGAYLNRSLLRKICGGMQADLLQGVVIQSPNLFASPFWSLNSK